MKLSLKVLSIGAALLSTAAFAQQQRKAPMIDVVSGQGYGTAGCGLGSIVFGTKPGIVQIFAATTNGTSGSQTFGISTGSSNCIDNGSVAQNKVLDLYLESNKVALANDVSRGNGESLTTLAKLVGCGDTLEFRSTLQKNYTNLFPSTNVETSALSSSIQTIIHNEASTCVTI